MEQKTKPNKTRRGKRNQDNGSGMSFRDDFFQQGGQDTNNKKVVARAQTTRGKVQRRITPRLHCALPDRCLENQRVKNVSKGGIIFRLSRYTWYMVRCMPWELGCGVSEAIERQSM